MLVAYPPQLIKIWDNLSLLEKEHWSRAREEWTARRASGEDADWDALKASLELSGPDPYEL